MSNIERKQQLDNRTLQLVDSEFVKAKKETVVAYLLWFFLGTLGIHRFYLGKTGYAVAILLLSIIGLLTIFIGVGFVLLGVSGVWAFVDLFLLPGMLLTETKKSKQKSSIKF